MSVVIRTLDISGCGGKNCHLQVYRTQLFGSLLYAKEILKMLMHTSQNPTLCLDFQQIYPDGLQSQPSLCDLMNKVAAEIPNRWQDIAVQLKLSVEWIQCVEHNNPRNPNGCYMQVFAAWEKKEDKTLPYTWESLLKILATPAVACKHLEQSIRASIQPGATTMTPADSQHCSHSPPQNFGQQSHCGNNEWFEKA